MANPLPDEGFLRLKQIIGDPGDPDADPPIPPTPAVIPVGKSTWYGGIKAGIYPKPEKFGRCSLWPVSPIRALLKEG